MKDSKSLKESLVINMYTVCLAGILNTMHVHCVFIIHSALHVQRPSRQRPALKWYTYDNEKFNQQRFKY